MATITTHAYPAFSENLTATLLEMPLATNADLFDVIDYCAALVNVLLETDAHTERMALCGRLMHVLNQVERLCEEDLPPYLLTKLNEAPQQDIYIPDCWQDTDMLLGYVQALTQTLLSNAQPEGVTKELTGLLHDLVYLLVDQLKTPLVNN
jgi:hypothetical protein